MAKEEEKEVKFGTRRCKETTSESVDEEGVTTHKLNVEPMEASKNTFTIPASRWDEIFGGKK